METYETNKTEERQGCLTVNELALIHLRETAKWTKFMAIISAIGIVFMALFALGSLIVGALNLVQGTAMNRFGGLSIGVIGVIYLLVAAVYITPTYYLFTYSSGIKRALLMRDEASLTVALGKMKSYWKFLGIFTIAALALYVLFILFMFVCIGIAGMANGLAV